MKTTERDEASLERLFARLLVLSLALPLETAACSSPPSHAVDAGVVDKAPSDPCAPKFLRAVPYSDAGDCRAFERLSCGPPSFIEPIDGGCRFQTIDCQTLCPGYGAAECHAEDASCPKGRLSSNGFTVVCDYCGAIGRRPRGLLPSAAPAGERALGVFFAAASRLEAASVRAFSELATMLSNLRAPVEFLHAARAAAEDEVRHARLTAGLARRFGARPGRPRVRRARARDSLHDVAIENAVEGCVRETYGAVFASWQAAHAADGEIAAAMRSIARDETRHAALAWAIARWAAPRLSAAERRHVEGAVREAAAALDDEIAEPPDELVTVAGLPDAATQTRLIAGLARDLWA